MWRRYFKLIKLRPGKVINQEFGEIDFRKDNIPVDTLKKLFESDFPYLEITDEGKEVLYGIEPKPKPKPKRVRKYTKKKTS